MQQTDSDSKTTSVKDVEQLGTFAAIASLSYVFWICGGMEMVERLAFYGVRSLAGIYGTDSVKDGGLGLVGAEIGTILSVWYFAQGIIPVFTGGLSDRLGYKETIFLSTVFKILGYLFMAWFASFWGFFAGALVIALGTGIFKPGIQGTIAKATNRKNSSVAWGIFYQTVNIGGFLGPMMAGYLRQTEWDNVFYACAAIISLNFLLLLTYKEPDKEERLALRAERKASGTKKHSLITESWRELTRPVVLIYMLLFTGFWFMLLIYWDLGPLYFRDWVDTSTIVRDIWGSETPGAFARTFFVMDHAGTKIMPEGIVNINAMLIMVFCFLVAGFSAKMKAANAMAVGTFLAASALIMIGGFNAAWVMVIGVVIFSLGEMLSSPKCLEFLANIAPSDKKAMYLGFANLPFALGALIEGFTGQYFYGKYAAIDQVARDHMIQTGTPVTAANAIPVGDAFERLVTQTGMPANDLMNELYAHYNIGTMFYIMAFIGILSAIGLYYYGRWTYKSAQQE
ncbi:MFS transporter [Kordiimonas pumila]|uniref:MFS transporter n=1 Tax=Kordiimonas pumila TaxID=2161677 RepID=A0ABV7D0G2_9PROT|nr:MFS transporter [Kordiimonas pumila]